MTDWLCLPRIPTEVPMNLRSWSFIKGKSMLKKFMILLLVAGAVALIPAGIAAFAEEGSYMPTEEWVPPVIDENDALENSPWLLVQ